MKRWRVLGGSRPEPPPLPDPITGRSLLGWICGQQKGQIVLATVFGILWANTTVVTPALLGKAIDQGIAEQSWPALWFWIATLIALGVAMSTVWVLRHFIASGLRLRSHAAIEQAVCERVLHPGGGIDDRMSSGDIVSLIAADTRRIALLMNMLSRSVGSVLSLVVILVAMFIVSPMLTLIIVLGLLPLFVAMLVTVKRLDRRTRRLQQALSYLAATASDTIGGLRIVKGVGGEDFVNNRYHQRSEAVLEPALATSRVQAAGASIDLAMPGVLATVIGWTGGLLALNDELTVGHLVAFAGWSVFLLGPLHTLNVLGSQWAMANAAAKRLASMLSLPPTIVATQTQESPAAAACELSFRNVRSNDVTLDFAIPKGQFTSIVASHHEAATIVSLCQRLLEPEAGAIELDGIPLPRFTLDDLRSRLLVAEHDAMLFRGTLRRNLEVADPSASEDDMRSALAVAGANDIVTGLEHGLDGIVSERGRSLSGGQRQRVALARALLVRPPVLLLVEPTSALDSYTENEIVSQLRSAREGQTTVVLTSSPALLDESSEVIFLDHGQIAGRGTHRELLERLPSYRARFVDDFEVEAEVTG